jgi:SAM-dependent methyltransferase
MSRGQKKKGKKWTGFMPFICSGVLSSTGFLMPDADLLGALNAVSGARNYREWVFRRIEQYLGLTVLDIGSGLGDFADLFTRVPGRRVILSDASEKMTAELRRRTAGRPGLSVMRLDATGEAAPEDFSGPFRPDTVTCLNVLEHLEDDLQALRNMRRWAAPGGKIILFVPALGCLYGSLDRLAGHYRRYGPKGLSECLRASGWAVLRLEYFNFWGMFTWFFAGRVLRQKRLDPAECGRLDRLVPALSFLEKMIKPSIGQSLVAVAENPA